MTRQSIDVHAHVGKTVANNIGQTVAEMLERMDRAGVTQALLSRAAGDVQSDGIRDTRRLNDIVASAVRDHPDRFPDGLGVIEPRHEMLAVEETVRVMDELGLAGLAVHPQMEGYRLDIPLWVDPIFEVLDDRRALCLMHSSPDPGSGESASDVRLVTSKYTNVTYFIGHGFMSPQQKAECIQIVKDLPHVYMDVAYQGDPRLTEELVRAVGSERVVFGSDVPFYELGEVLNSVLDADISEEDKDNILFKNIQKVLEARR
ncbi:MAG: amidohydrolase family protein [Microbacteriaceae bacterium]|nr:amidohydrolase family protein [Microbacteriaceae bacterium]